jgi:DNA-binding NarL/FixJ family response regulator
MSAPITVLIVDGHPGVRTALVSRLHHTPQIRAVCAVGALDAAVRMIEELAPHVVLYDPRTVAGDSEQVVRRLGQGGCPVIVLTSSLRDGEARALMRAGAAAILLKGEERSDLLAAIEAAARGADTPQPAVPAQQQ